MNKASIVLKTSIIQIINIAPSTSLDQLRTLFGHIGPIDKLVLYPEEDKGETVSKVGYIRFKDTESAGVALHLNNTVFLDRALIVLPLADDLDQIPEESFANLIRAPMYTTAGVPPRNAEWPVDVISLVVGKPGEQVIMTIDPRISTMGLPPYPPLPATTDSSKIEEIRRTVLVTNLDQGTTAEQVLEFFGVHADVRFVRVADSDAERAAYVEFTHQTDVSKAFQLMGATLNNKQIMVQHSTTPITKLQAMMGNGFDEAAKRVKEAESLISGSVDKMYSRSRSRSRRRSSHHRSSRSRRRSRSRDFTRSSRSRRKSKSRDVRRSRSRDIRNSRSKRRSRSKNGRSSRSKKSPSRTDKSRRSRSPDKKESRPRRRSQSRDRRKSRSKSTRRDKDKVDSKRKDKENSSDKSKEKSTHKEKEKSLSSEIKKETSVEDKDVVKEKLSHDNNKSKIDSHDNDKADIAHTSGEKHRSRQTRDPEKKEILDEGGKNDRSSKRSNKDRDSKREKDNERSIDIEKSRIEKDRSRSLREDVRKRSRSPRDRSERKKSRDRSRGRKKSRDRSKERASSRDRKKSTKEVNHESRSTKEKSKLNERERRQSRERTKEKSDQPKDKCMTEQSTPKPPESRKRSHEPENLPVSGETDDSHTLTPLPLQSDEPEMKRFISDSLESSQIQQPVSVVEPTSVDIPVSEPLEEFKENADNTSDMEMDVDDDSNDSKNLNENVSNGIDANNDKCSIVHADYDEYDPPPVNQSTLV